MVKCNSATSNYNDFPSDGVNCTFRNVVVLSTLTLEYLSKHVLPLFLCV